MRYTRKQMIITTVFDDEILEIEVIKDLLKTFCKSDIDISIEFKDNKNQQIKYYDKIRIKSINENSIDILVFQKSFNVSIKGILFTNIVSIKLVTEKQSIVLGEEKLSRNDLLDIDNNT